MPRLFFSGVVLPERAPLSVSEVGSQVIGHDGKVYAMMKLNISHNQITVVVDSDEPNIYTLRNIVRSEAEYVTNVAGFLLGYGYDIEITKAFGDGLSPTHIFGIDIPVLAERVNGRDVSVLLNGIYTLGFGVDAIYLRRCLADLSFSIKRPDDTAFYCYRALESLRQSFGAELTDAEQWTAMGKEVGSSKEEMEFLRSHAFPARHGIPKPISDEERKKMFLYTWNVVERYVDYRLKVAGLIPVFSTLSN